MVLAQTARKHGYNVPLLRLLVAAYRLSRTVGMDGVQSAPMTATRGITAASGFATTELRILIIDTHCLSVARPYRPTCTMAAQQTHSPRLTYGPASLSTLTKEQPNSST